MKNYIIFLSGVAVCAAFFVFTAYTDPDTSGQQESSKKQSFGADRSTDRPFQTVYAPPIPDQIEFAGEELPKEKFDALERFDRELMAICFGHSTTMNNMKLAARYFPTIEPILAKNGVPDDIKYLAVTESNLRNATSPAGAKGIWQFMPETAKSYGLEVSNEIDERYHLEKVTEAACKLLSKSRKDFGSWTLAAAAYNMGPGRLRGHLDFQKHTSYYDLHMNQETSRYVPRILVFKYVMQDPKKYGFHLDKEDLYPALPKYKIVEVKGAVPSWSDFAQQNGITYRNLKVHNPWILEDKLTNKAGKTYQVQIPIDEK